MTAVRTKKVISLNSVFRYFLLLLAILFFGMVLRQNERDKKTANRIDSVIAVLPEKILPGDPVMITINASSSPVVVRVDGTIIPMVIHNGKHRAFAAIPFEEKEKDKKIEVKLGNGQLYTKIINIIPRKNIEKPLGIPDKMGGNTQTAGKALVSNLESENKFITNIETSPTALWSKSFVSPLKTLFVTDEYGYGRNTVGYNITHKGADFRAATGTEVMAINSGIVRVARLFNTYGNTIILDHGNGLSSLYMHLSGIKVKVGQRIEAGQIIGYSGQTGYASAPHLHLSIKVNGISIDPVKFLHFFNVL
jgi:murein DD-endopeptidase MepM/ murein hydrolase activator NlpD